MRSLIISPVIALCLCAASVFAQTQQPQKKTSIERGRLAARGRPAFSPPIWTQTGYDNVWKQWGVAKKPADYDRAFRLRYGLHPAPYKNDGLPMGLHASKGILGKGFVNDCLLCHAGAIAGKTYVGLGNSSLDLQSLFTELSAASGTGQKMPFHFSHARGTIDPISPLSFLLQFRDKDLNLNSSAPLGYFDNVVSDPPAWWLLKKKRTRQWTGNMDARSARVDIVNLLSPFNSAAHIKKQDPLFVDIHAFVMSIEAPKYPFPIDRKLAAVGRKVFNLTCARCHGTYGPKATYPNKIVPFETIGTDRTLALAVPKKLEDFYNQSWLGQEKSRDGTFFHVHPSKGYQAPPLDGVWATAPYFHNASAPTLYHVLNSKARPKYFTRSFRSGKDEYDRVKGGWKITVLDAPPDPKMPAIERRKIYDTTLPGRSNAGHDFGDDLTERERLAVVEYLKSL